MRKRSIIACLVVAGGIAAGVALWMRDRTPLLTAAALDEAQARWLMRAPEDYDLALRVQNDRAAPILYSVTVRQGSVVEFKASEGSGAQASTAQGAYYAIAGLFEILRRELELKEGPPVAGAPAGAVLRADFDPEMGYPRVFKRLAGQGASSFIHVERLTPRT